MQKAKLDYGNLIQVPHVRGDDKEQASLRKLNTLSNRAGPLCADFYTKVWQFGNNQLPLQTNRLQTSEKVGLWYKT